MSQTPHRPLYTRDDVGALVNRRVRELERQCDALLSALEEAAENAETIATLLAQKRNGNAQQLAIISGEKSRRDLAKLEEK